ncbi:MAG: urease accessory protein UreD [Cypionkella sp.]|nr:urease accessory protein UreD [Cypionkella sp.]
MFDAMPSPHMQRSFGIAKAVFSHRAGRSALDDLAQSGSAKVMLPRVFSPDPEVVFLNTSGGLTGGDSLSYAIDIGAGSRVVATTQTAERAYASTGAAARVKVTLNVGSGAHLDWLPQETILFEDAHLSRRTEVNLAADASAVLVESLVLGRQAMGEVPRRARLTDQRMLRRDGRPIWAETLRIDAGVLAQADGPAILGGAKALAVIAHVAQNAQDAAQALRALPVQDGAAMAVSGWNGRCIIRITATDSWPLRAQIIRVISTLRGGPMPRVWQC